ncbi:cadherin repeat domain-containing protein [Marinoscillum sp.]|uniref:cadherin repeat domain-containing protein n=1 Tax=Marinoscillum sp. TaxID=2024838 RepID=UPI003BABA6AD
MHSNQDVTITVTDVDDTAPVFTSALTASFAENGTGTAYTALATDANALTYSLGTGNDESLFDIVGSTGVVTFKTAPDFENPADADANNTYVINVVASDGTNASNQDVTITVTDVDDTAPVFKPQHSPPVLQRMALGRLILL